MTQGSAIVDRYLARTPKSAERNAEAAKSMPGGDTRSTAWFQPYPPFVAEGHGAAFTDIDGNRYIELLNNYTSLIHGHAHPAVVEAIQQQVARGSALRRTARGHDAPVADPRRADAHRRPGPVCQLRHRGRDDGSPRRTRLHRPTADCKGGGRLPRDLGRHHRQRRAAARSGRPGRAADDRTSIRRASTRRWQKRPWSFPSTTSRRPARSSSRSATNSPASSSSPSWAPAG